MTDALSPRSSVDAFALFLPSSSYKIRHALLATHLRRKFPQHPTVDRKTAGKLNRTPRVKGRGAFPGLPLALLPNGIGVSAGNTSRQSISCCCNVPVTTLPGVISSDLVRDLRSLGFPGDRRERTTVSKGSLS